MHILTHRIDWLKSLCNETRANPTGRALHYTPYIRQLRISAGDRRPAWQIVRGYINSGYEVPRPTHLHKPNNPNNSTVSAEVGTPNTFASVDHFLVSQYLGKGRDYTELKIAKDKTKQDHCVFHMESRLGAGWGRLDVYAGSAEDSGQDTAANTRFAVRFKGTQYAPLKK